MKRSVKALLVSGAIVAGLTGAAAPAHAATCMGVSYNAHGPDEILFWDCDPCPSLTHGPLDGRFHVIVCLPEN